MKLDIRLHLVKKVKIVYPEFTIDTKDYPELEGRTLDEIRDYIEHHIQHMHPIGNGFDSLEDELRGEEEMYTLEEYPEESRFYVQASDEYGLEEEE